MFRYSVIRGGAKDSSQQQQEKEAEKETTPGAIATLKKHALERSTILAKSKELLEGRPTTSHDERFLLARGYFLMDRDLLGEGTYSKVKRAYSKLRRHDVAIKIVNRKIAPKDFLKRFLPRELEIIGQINHPNICKFYEVLDIGEKVFIIMEHAPKGDLLEHIQRYKFMKEDLARSLFLQIVNALSYLHAYNILHRDLKCENILLTKDLKPLLTDFGFAKHLPKFSDLNRTFCGSSAYAPIEILKGIAYDGASAEVWSLGCILYIIATGTMPFDDSNKAEQIKQMKKGPNFARTKQSISVELRTLIVQMLQVNPQKRILLKEIPCQEWSKLATQQKQQTGNQDNK